VVRIVPEHGPVELLHHMLIVVLFRARMLVHVCPSFYAHRHMHLTSHCNPRAPKTKLLMSGVSELPGRHGGKRGVR